MPKPHFALDLAKKSLFPLLLAGAIFFSAHEASAMEAYRPNDPYFAEQWYLRQIGAPEAWTMTKGSRDVLVAVIDGGMDLEHPDLREAIWRNAGEIPDDGADNDGNGFIDDAHGWNFVRRNGDVRPMSVPNQTDGAWSHGTITASLIAGKGDNHFGIAGVAWNVKILPLVILDGDGFGYVPDIAKAVDYAIAAGADIINLSVFGFEDEERVREAIRRANDADILVVAAVGNDYSAPEGMDVNWIPTFPACAEREKDGVLGVTATDVLDQHAAHANTGADCTDLAAPGHGMIASHPTKMIPLPEYEEEAGIKDVVFDLSGTSLSAPLVSGAAALVKSVRPDWTAMQIREHLLRTSDAISGSSQMDDPAPLGAGRLNIGRAIRELPPLPAVLGETHHVSTPRQAPFAERLVKTGLRSLFSLQRLVR